MEHGCTCTEAGILLDIFTPMREDFVQQTKKAVRRVGRTAFCFCTDYSGFTCSSCSQ